MGVSLLAVHPELELRGGLDVLEEARRWLEPRSGVDPHSAVLVGTIDYELGHEIEWIGPAARISQAPLRLAGFRAVYVYRHGSGAAEIVGTNPAAVNRLEEIVRSACGAKSPPLPLLATPRCTPPDEPYREAVRAIQGWIRAGDVYQVNLAREIVLPSPAPRGLRSLYAHLTASSPAPFCAYLERADDVVLSNSPERFLRLREREIETCPIKGTRPRGPGPSEDSRLARALLASAKDRAEHVMIVDLERNDLGRICETGTVSVDRLAELQSFATVHHLVSSIRGRVRTGTDWEDILAATFPGGSITGAPKVRAMQILAQIETTERGIYTGALGCFDAAGGVDLSIPIRTAVSSGGVLRLHLGGGIVADSDPEAELEETRQKGLAFTRLWGGCE